MPENLQAHWEHGYRCHGYWCDKTGDRLGFVGLGPPGVWDKIYRVRMDRWMHTRPTEEYKKPQNGQTGRGNPRESTKIMRKFSAATTDEKTAFMQRMVILSDDLGKLAFVWLSCTDSQRIRPKIESAFLPDWEDWYAPDLYSERQP